MDSRFSLQSCNFDGDVRALDASEEAKLVNAAEANLKPFMDRGRKLIIVHGWSDGTDSSIATLNYCQSVVSKMGSKAVGEFMRLYMAPGRQHGGRGQRPNRFRGTMMLEAGGETCFPGPRRCDEM